MNTYTPRLHLWKSLCLPIALSLCASAALHATTYVWNKDTNGSWTVSANWTASPTGFPNAAGAVADFSQLNITGTRTVTLGSNVTVGTLLIGDTNALQGYVLSTSNNSVLTFDSGSEGTAATLKNTAQAYNNSLRVNISLLSDLIVTNESVALSNTTSGYLDIGLNNGGQTLSAGSAGLKTLTFSSASTKRINVYSAIQDGAGTVGVYAGVYALASVSSTQALTFFSTNSFTGGLTVSGRLVSGSLTLSGATTTYSLGDAALGGQGCAITLAGGSINFSGTATSSSDMIIDRNITLLSGGGSLEPNSNLTLTVTGVIDGAGALTKTAAGTIVLTGTNSYAGGTTIGMGTLSVLNDSSLGASGTTITMNGGALQFLSGVNVPTSQRSLIINANSTIRTDGFVNWYGALSGSGLLTKTGSSTFSINNPDSSFSGGYYVGAGGIRFRGGDSAIGVAGVGITLASGATLLSIDNQTLGTGRTLTLVSGTSNIYVTGSNTITLTWDGDIVGAGALNINGNGIVVLTKQAAYTGDTTVSAGTLQMAGDNRIASTSSLILNGGSFDLNNFNQTLDTLKLQDDSTIVMGDSGVNLLVLAASSGEAWITTASLTITGNVVSGQSIRVGTDSSGLTADQLDQILVNGNEVGIDTSGYLTFVPEPAALAQIMGISALLFVGLRRRSLKR